jgi:hypothetical protein
VAVTLVAAGCVSTGADDGDGDRCLRALMGETATVERQYREGRLAGVERVFLDRHGTEVAVIVAEARVRDRDAVCDELWGPVAGDGGAP